MAQKGDTGRPRRHDILDAALEILLEQGYEATTMDSVAHRAGVARRTLFNQFETKEALFSAAIERVWARAPIIEIVTGCEALEDPATGLTRIGRAIAEFWAPPAAVALARMVIREGVRFPALVRDYLTLGKVPSFGLLVDYLRVLEGSGRLVLADPDLAARQFVGLITEPLVWLRVLGLEETPEPAYRARVVEEAVATFLARYAPK
jgi:AcrR family transcriptional regulator